MNTVGSWKREKTHQINMNGISIKVAARRNTNPLNPNLREAGYKVLKINAPQRLQMESRAATGENIAPARKKTRKVIYI